MNARVHAICGGIATLTILSFWTSTLVSELLLSHQAVVIVKLGILYGMAVLIPALAGTGASGMLLGRAQSRVVLVKKKRMRMIALNGLMVLLPAAFFLYRQAAAGQFDALFYGVQAIEFAAGLANIILMALNMRDGMLLAGRMRLARVEPQRL